MKQTILALAFLGVFGAAPARAQVTCTPFATIPDGPEFVYQPGTAFEVFSNCTTNGTSLYYDWGPTNVYDGFDGKPKLNDTLKSGGTFVGLGVFQQGSCLPEHPDCFDAPLTAGPFAFDFHVSNSTCDVIDREHLGKNVKIQRGPNIKIMSGKPHTETCVVNPTISKDGICKNSCACDSTCAANPVNLSTGSMWHAQTDFVVPGRTSTTKLEITRTYTANAAVEAGGFGPNWRHNYETVLKKSAVSGGSDFDLVWIDEGGGPYFFERQSDGSYKSPNGLRNTITVGADFFEIKKPDNTKYRFSKTENSTEVLTSLTDPHGESLALAYDVKRRLSTVSAPFAGSITFFYNSNDQIERIHRDRDNLDYFYTYQSNGRLSSVTDYLGRVYSFAYTVNPTPSLSDGMLKTIVDPIGRKLQFTYYADGRAKQQYEAGGGVWEFRYGDHKTMAKSPNGEVNMYFYDENLRNIKQVQPDGARVFHEWTNGFETATHRDFGGTTKLGYDANGNANSIQRPEDPSPTLITYDQNFNKPVMVHPIVGAPTQYSLDQVTGDLIQMSRNGLSLSYTRDPFGNLLSTNNGISTYSDQRNGNGFLATVFDLHNPETRSYDSRGRVIAQNFLGGRTVSISYNSDDQVTSISDSNGPSVLNEYDLMQRLVKKTVSANSISKVASYVYDDKDRLISIKDPLNRVTTFSYDLTRVRNQPVSVTDPAGRITRFVYDGMDRLSQKIDAIGAVTKFTYDSRGNMTSVTDSLGHVTRYYYDLNNRKIREVRPSVAGTSAAQRVTDYFYDSADHLVREVTHSFAGGADRTLIYEYDSLDRLVKKVIQKDGISTVVEDESLFTYENQLDAVLMKTAVNGVASLGFSNEAAPPFASSGFSVAASQSGNPLGLIEGAFGITRDVTGEIASVSKNGTTLFTKSYDPAGRLTGVAAPGGFSTSIGYDGFGNRNSIQHSTGEQGSFQRDLLERLTQVIWTGPTPISETLTYDPLTGNISNIARENGSYTLAHDAVDQLISSTGLDSKSYSYDALGNRLSDSANGGGSFVNNFLVANGVSSFLADPNGFGDVLRETSGSAVKNYAYRADDLLNGVQNGSTQAEYYFDALGRREAKVLSTPTGTFTQSYVYLGTGARIILGRSGDGVITTYIDGNTYGEYLGEVKGGVAKGYITDHLGSILNSDPAGGNHRFGLFGQATGTAPLSTSSDAASFGYAGGMFNRESGTTTFSVRDLNHETGRWQSQDPDGLESGMNLYQYAGNSPVRYTDLSGKDGGATAAAGTIIILCPECVLGAAAGAAIGAGLYCAGTWAYDHLKQTSATDQTKPDKVQVPDEHKDDHCARLFVFKTNKCNALAAAGKTAEAEICHAAALEQLRQCRSIK